MFEVEGVTYKFHHLGVPSPEIHQGERYSPADRMYTCDAPTELVRLQWHRFEPGSPMHPLLQIEPHLAFTVSDLDRAIAGKRVILGPHEPIPGFRIAAIEDGGVAIELIETSLSDEQIRRSAKTESPQHRRGQEVTKMLEAAAA